MKEWLKRAYKDVLKALIIAKDNVIKALKIAYIYVIKASKIVWNYFTKHYVKIGFYFLAFIFILNAIFMTVFLINRNYGYRIVNNLYAEAILPDQDLNNTLKTGIVKVEEIDYEEINVGDKIVFCCDMGADSYWVQEVVEVNRVNKLLQTTYDGETAANVSEDEIYGVYVTEANFFGTLFYTAMFPRGYIMLILSEIFFVYIYHYVFIQKKLNEILKKSKITESDISNETD
ncbi:MAG: hypothetical protein PF513_02440 [Tenericutes bacterium]|jgi:hypothetical protein|nr:hypothetical protein [Mycoplasmatota bacterium]